MSIPQPNLNYSQGTGTSSTSVFITHLDTRDPNNNDFNYPVTKRWVNTVTGNEWMLIGFNSFGGATNPIWRNLSSGNVSELNSLQGNSGGAVSPTNNTIQIVGDGTSINAVGNPGTSTITLSAVSGGSGIVTLDADSGSATGGTVTIEAGTSTSNCGRSVQFSASGSSIELNVTDSNSNTFIGKNSGQYNNTGEQNVSLGYSALGYAQFNGSDNVAIGYNALFQITDGSNNIGIGAGSGSENDLTDSSNIYFNNEGVTGESNCLRVGFATGTNNQELSKAFICGINGSTPSGTLLPVAINGSDQLTAGGVITNPSQPAFRAFVGAPISNVTGDGTIYTIIFNQKSFDIGNHFNTTTGTYTFPVTGLYQLNVTVDMQGIPAVSNQIIAKIFSSGVSYYIYYNSFGPVGDNGTEIVVSGSIFLQANANDTATVTIAVSNATKIIGVNGDTDGIYTSFSGFLVC